MVDTALIWIGLLAGMSVFGAGSFFLYYLTESEFDYHAAAWVFVGSGGVVELSMANGYLPENALFSWLVGGCAIAGIVVILLGVRQSQRGFQYWRADPQ